jgi:hypothetical protein
VKIIKKGIPPKYRRWIGECRFCFAEAIAADAEITNTRSEISFEDCPSCGSDGGMVFRPSREMSGIAQRHRRSGGRA